jgi:hypothetical protein
VTGSDSCGWETWLEELERGVAELDRRLAAHEPASFPDPLVPVSAADGPVVLPAALVPRAAQVLDQLEQARRRVEHRRSELSRELGVLARPRHRPTGGYGYEIGQTLDVAG